MYRISRLSGKLGASGGGRINNLRRADQINSPRALSRAIALCRLLLPIVADAEAGFGGMNALN